MIFCPQHAKAEKHHQREGDADPLDEGGLLLQRGANFSVRLLIPLRQEQHGDAEQQHDVVLGSQAQGEQRAVGKVGKLRVEQRLFGHPDRREKARGAGDVAAEEDDYIGPDQPEEVPAPGRIVDVQGLLPPVEAGGEQEGEGDGPTVPKAEGDVAPVGSVPDADDQVDKESCQGGGEDLAQLAFDVPAGQFPQLAEGLGQGEGIEEIVPHPGPQGDVPAPPKIRE